MMKFLNFIMMKQCYKFPSFLINEPVKLECLFLENIFTMV
jgi:hypothetical protein